MINIDYLKKIVDRQNAIYETEGTNFAESFYNPEGILEESLENANINPLFLQSQPVSTKLIASLLCGLSKDIYGNPIHSTLTSTPAENLNGLVLQMATDSVQNRLVIARNYLSVSQKNLNTAACDMLNVLSIFSSTSPRTIQVREITESRDVFAPANEVNLSYGLVVTSYHDDDVTSSYEIFLEVKESAFPKKYQRLIHKYMTKNRDFHRTLTRIEEVINRSGIAASDYSLSYGNPENYPYKLTM